MCSVMSWLSELAIMISIFHLVTASLLQIICSSCTFSFSLSLIVICNEVDDFCLEKSKVATDSKGWTPRNDALISITADLKLESRKASHFRAMKHKKKRILDIWFVDVNFILLSTLFLYLRLSQSTAQKQQPTAPQLNPTYTNLGTAEMVLS